MVPDEGEPQKRMGSYITCRHRTALRLFQKHLDDFNSFLDIGCGDGAATKYFSDGLRIKETYGVDQRQDAVELAEEQGVRAIKCDIDSEALPFADHQFDAIFAGEIIEHVVYPDRALTDMKRVLKKNGVIVLTTPNLASWMNRLMLLAGWQPFETGTSRMFEVGRPRFLKFGTAGGMGGHLHLYTLRALKELMGLHGLKVTESAGCGSREEEREADARWPYYARVTFVVDSLMSKITSLAPRLVIAAKSKD